MKDISIAIIGGGIAGSSIALYLSQFNLHVKLFEKGKSLVNGPPICHLHAGGNLYREISDEQCITLLKESIELVRFYPDAIDYRPTLIVTPLEDDSKPQDLFRRLHLLQKEYENLIQKDYHNKVLGESSEYFKLYEKDEIEFLQQQNIKKEPVSLDDWMISASKSIDISKVKFPLIMVQEYGINLFRLASNVTLALKKEKNSTICLEHKVTNITKTNDNRWNISYKNSKKVEQESFDFLINAAGFRSGNIDDFLGFKPNRLVEFKAAYVSKWDEHKATLFPEIIFHGERGTPRGMAQFTPYPNGYFQLHGMTKDITLFNEGLVKSTPCSAYPKLSKKLIDKIDFTWSLNDSKTRTKRAITHMAQFIPSFKNAKVISKPLYGAQQIPGDDASLRAANVSFEEQTYARCEIVKASSVLSMADEIAKQLVTLGFMENELYENRTINTLSNLSEKEISEYAALLCKEREYPISLSKRVKTEKNKSLLELNI